MWTTPIKEIGDNINLLLGPEIKIFNNGNISICYHLELLGCKKYKTPDELLEEYKKGEINETVLLSMMMVLGILKILRKYEEAKS